MQKFEEIQVKTCIFFSQAQQYQNVSVQLGVSTIRPHTLLIFCQDLDTHNAIKSTHLQAM
jgi:hypothetical protein